MTLLYTDGFDTKDTPSRWTVTTTNTFSGTTAPAYTSSTRFGTGFAASLPYDITTLNGYLRITKPFIPSAHIYIGASIETDIRAGQAYSVPFHGLLADAATTGHLYLVATTAGAVQVWRGDPQVTTGHSGSLFTPNGTMIAASAAGIINATWHYVELGATIDASAGVAVVQVDGVQVISFTGNTKNGGTSANIDAVCFSGFSVYNGSSIIIGSPAIDDLYICNSSGSANNGFLGDIRVQTLLATGAGSSTQFTPTGSGSNYANVNDVPNSPATFNADSVPGHRDTYAMADLLASTGTVFAIQQTMIASKSDAGAASLKGAQKSGATVSYGATRTLGTSAVMYVDMFETNPATSAAWTAADVNGLEAGAEVV